MDYSAFHREESWHGTYCELALELGPSGNDALLASALQALWAYPKLQGPWSSRTVIGIPEAVSSTIDRTDHMFGVAHINSTITLGCIAHVVREEPGSDWLDLCFPTGMLEEIFPVVYPLSNSNDPWLQSLDSFFTELAVAIYKKAPFALGIVGEEVSGMLYAATLTPEDSAKYMLLLPSNLSERMHFTECVVPLEAGLVSVGFGK